MRRSAVPIACVFLLSACGSAASSMPGGGGADTTGEPGDGTHTPADAAAPTPVGEDPPPSSDDAGAGMSIDAAGRPAASATSGQIDFHLLLGVTGSSTPGDSITLTGDNYTDLIASNFVAGVMYGHLIQKQTPTMQFDEDYLYGSIFGQLLQENLATELYTNSSNLIDSSPMQQAVMGAGQGGPYQINNYAADLVYGSYVPQGNSLINYVAVQKNIGYSFASAATQYTQVTPPSFNDYVALHKVGVVGGYTPQWEPAYDEALVAFEKLPGSFLDVLLNVAYNQGYYGPLVSSYSLEGATATAATVAKVDDYASVWGVDDTYQQYPYQVRYYLDQLYDKPTPMTGIVPDNHVVFAVSQLRSIFASCFQTLAYVDASSAYGYITAAEANAAFDAATAATGVASGATLDLGNAAERAQIFATLRQAIGKLETALGTDFTATTLTAL